MTQTWKVWMAAPYLPSDEMAVHHGQPILGTESCEQVYASESSCAPISNSHEFILITAYSDLLALQCIQGWHEIISATGLQSSSFSCGDPQMRCYTMHITILWNIDNVRALHGGGFSILLHKRRLRQNHQVLHHNLPGQTSQTLT